MMHSASLRRLFDIVDELVDERVGIIRSLEELPKEAGAPVFFYYYAETCNTSAFSRQKNFGNTGGASADRGLAMAKAIGEAIERYCPAIYDIEEFPLASFDSASFCCVPPSDFAFHSPRQYARPDFPYVPFEHDTPVRWAPAVDPTTGETWHVPAAMIYMPYYFDKDNGESPIGARISTGLACHCSYAEAAISAIGEVIERDAFTITWQARLTRPHIRIETLSTPNQDLVERFERTGSTVTLLDLTMDHGVPTILSVMQGRAPDAPALVFAASTALDPEEAVRKSLEELAHSRRLAQQLTTQRPRLVPTPDYENVVTQDDHVHFYCDQAQVPLADFIFLSPKRLAFDAIQNLSTGDPEQDLAILVQKVKAVGHQVLLADLTTPDVRELGLAVVRAVIPGFHPLFIGHKVRALGGRRLWEVPQRLGYVGITYETGDNPAPHPFP